MPYRLENRRIIRAALAAFAVAFALGATAAHAGFERSLEKMLGNQARNAIEAQYVVIAEGPAAEYLQRTGESLVDASPRHDIEYTFKLLDTEQVNAFALPWGYVYVTTGMLRFVDSSDQLAGVVGHEIAHVSQKHSLDAFKKQFWASLLLGVIEAPAALLTAGNVGATLYLLRHSRKDEQDSDKLGARYAYTAGYDASQLADFLRKLHAEQKRKPSSIEIYLSTHPTGERRQERLAELPELDQDSPEVAAHTARGFLDRHLANQAVVAYRRAASLAPADAEARAGLVRAYAEAGDAQLARQELARALEIGLSEEDARTLEMVVAEAPPAPGRDVSADESDAQPRVHSDEQRLADVREAAAAWSMEAQEPARKIEERSKSLGERVRGVARRMSMTGAFGSPAFGTQRVMEKAETALYLIAETTDRVGATGEGLKSVSATAGEILAAVERDSAAPAAAGDRARWQALAREIAEVVATAEEETQQVSEQALRAAKLADEAVGHLNSAVSAMATEFNAFGGLRGSAPFLGLAEGDADRALKAARDALEASRQAGVALQAWNANELSWQLSSAYLGTPSVQRPMLRRIAAAMIGMDAGALTLEPGVGFGAAVLHALAPQPAQAGDEPAAAEPKSDEAAPPPAPRGETLMLKLILADVRREAEARSRWQAAAPTEQPPEG